ncbi:MAG: DUF503 domain-containing protein [Candidatus Omnitrophica bacterium]|nr:DUF503 domain-containing protein [Candidatus Omnitrophota bacterium]
MTVGTLRLKIHFPEAQSLKEKRFVLKSLKDRVRRKFNVSISEIGEGKDLWQVSELAFAAVGDEQKHLNGVLDQLKHILEQSPDYEITESALEFF